METLSRGIKNRVLLTAAGAFALLALLALPNIAEAAKFANPAKYNGGTLFLVEPLNARKGKTVSVATDWEKKKAVVRTQAYDKNGVADYVTRISKPKYGAIAGKQGKFGKVSLKFRPVSQQKIRIKVNHNRCSKNKKAKGFVQGGFLRGKVKFKGEKGYIKVSEKLKGQSAETWGNRLMLKLPKCAFKPQRVESPEPKKGRGAQLMVGNKNVSLYVAGYDGGSRTKVIHLVANNKKGKTEIFREALIDKSDVRFGVSTYPQLDVAEVKASEPQLRGKGEFVRGIDDAYSWTGSLRANFPGLSNVSLTSSKIDVSLKYYGFVPLSRALVLAPATPAVPQSQPESLAEKFDIPSLPFPG